MRCVCITLPIIGLTDEEKIIKQKWQNEIKIEMKKTVSNYGKTKRKEWEKEKQEKIAESGRKMAKTWHKWEK